MASVSVAEAIRRGMLQVYGLFFPCIVGIPFLAFRVLNLSDLAKGLSVLLGIVAAWVWWSFQVPRWRIWALQHVDDIETLHQRAVQVGIEWSYGSVFERTEIKTRQQLLQEAALQLRYYLQRVQRIVSEDDSSTDLRNVSQELDEAIAQVMSGQLVALSILDSLEQSLIQRLSQQGQRETDIANAYTFAATIYFITKYRRASDQFKSKT
jgi:hypothetical protein